MNKTPICLRIDDPTPIISVYYTHNKTGKTEDGRPIEKKIPMSLLYDFCDLVEKYGIKGKFTVVPMPGNRGDIVNGIEGVTEDELNEWLSVVRERIAPNFSIAPEMLTHNKAVDIETGKVLELNEEEWADFQDRYTFSKYIVKALSLLKQAGFDCSGVSSPWTFGKNNVEEYRAGIADAVYGVYEKEKAFYFLHGLSSMPYANPWIAYSDEHCKLVAIPTTTHDVIWQTIHTTENSEEYVSRVADEWITEDGSRGQIITALEKGCMPVLITHWQSLASNGLFTGFKVLTLVCERIEKNLSDRVEWKSAEEIMNMVE